MSDQINRKTFSTFSQIIDNRILRALADLGFARPTNVQAKVIPLAIEGRDILARAKTGSGKTAAYGIPSIQKVLTSKAVRLYCSSALSVEAEKVEQVDSIQTTRCLILVPTRELSDQVTKHIRDLLVYCEKEVSVVNVASNTVAQIQKSVNIPS